MPELLSAAPANGQVQIRTSSGKIDITSSALFTDGDDRSVHTLIECLFESNAVASISVDHARFVVEILYEPTAVDLPNALRTFAAALHEADQNRPATRVREHLECVPGR